MSTQAKTSPLPLARVSISGGVSESKPVIRGQSVMVEQVGHRFSATLHRAKQQGWQVEKRQSDVRVFEYRLVSMATPGSPLQQKSL